jgi:hypothetical protein
MNFKTTIVLLVVLVAVGVYLAVGHVSTNSQDTTTTTTPGKLIDLDSSNVKQVSITQPDGKRIVLDKADSKWRLTEPVNAPADSSAADELVRQITGLTAHGKLPAEQKGSVGLDHPNYQVQITAIDGKVTRLAVGDKSQISDALYVTVNDDSTPQVVPSAFNEQVAKTVDAYRSKKLVDASTDQVKQLAITQNGQTIRLEKQGANWQITEPKSMPADSGELSTLLFALTDLNAVEFVTGSPKPETYGLAKPEMTVWYSMSAPSTQPSSQPASQPSGTTIAFGRFDSVLQKNVYASVNGGPIVTVPVSGQISLTKTALDLRDRKVLDIDPAQVESFTLAVNRPAATQPTTRPAEQHEYTLARRQEKTILGPTLPTEPTTGPSTQGASSQPASQPTIAAATQPASKWIIQSGGTGDANDAQIEALLSSLHPLQATKFLDKAPATTQPADEYTLTVHAGPANGHGPADYTLHISATTATGPASATLNDLTFETERGILDKLDINFKGGK